MTPPHTIRRYVEDAADWAVGFTLADAPRDVIELSQLQIANILSAILAGSRSAAGRKTWQAMRPTITGGPCTLIPHGIRGSLWDALYLHAVYANALELDDFHYRGHLGPAVVGVPLAMAEAGHGDGQALLRAHVIANELGGRLGAAADAEIRHGHQRSYLLRFAAAAAAGALLGLDARRMAHALAIAMTQPEQPLHPGMFSPETKTLSAASSVVEGARAAHLAAEGLGAALDILEHRAGFFRQFTLQRHTPNPFVQLGEAWSTHALSFKRYAACGYAAGAVDAAREIRQDPAFDVGAIARVDVASSLPAVMTERLAQPHDADVLTPTNVQFSIRRSVAYALLAGDLRGDAFAEETFPAAVGPIHTLSTRVCLLHDWTYTVHQLKGIDAGMRRGAGRGSADVFQFYRTFSEFRRMFGSDRAIGIADVGRLMRLSPEDRGFFAARWAQSARRVLGLSSPDAGQGPFGDLRNLSYRMGGRVTVTLANGRQLTAERIVPSGMAGDPGRADVVRDKLATEAGATLGATAAAAGWNAILALEQAKSVTLPRLFTAS